ncbi:uncharacterized GPI-anchored protein At4g28100 [Mercurialis annua]|uniref:uncharacterized GPI-anchored protein At4g28100 n=1 Tax=Mercurialis annua TaxID=3986 RepID=UPI00215E8558|nr:uncharacterized GPI-anchored protein At4g28100 [Mercurialis annua]
MLAKMQAFVVTLIVFSTLCTPSLAGLLAEPVQPLKPGDYSSPNTVPAFPVQTESQVCRLDLSAELFGGVNDACGRDLDRSRCCPVLAAWLFAAHARYALQVSASAPAASAEAELPMMPDDSQKCVNSLQSALLSKNVKIPQPNASCDAILCFCGIRLHQISSLSCPAAFNVSSGFHNATPTAAVKNLEKNCRNSSYSGCTKCLGALQKLKGSNKTEIGGRDERANKMFNRDCQLMGLTWLLARNKTEYIPTVSAVLRAIMYSAHPPHQSKCSPDQENMPLAVDSLQFEKAQSSSSSLLGFPVIPIIIIVSMFGYF